MNQDSGYSFDFFWTHLDVNSVPKLVLKLLFEFFHLKSLQYG